MIIGIDLGTTNSVVCIYKKGIVQTLDIYGHKTTPSVVNWNPTNHKFEVGYNAKKRMLIDPENTIVSCKKFMGDPDKLYHINNQTYTPSDIASIIIEHLKRGAEEIVNEKVTKAIITVPAYFKNNQKQDTKLAAEKAGLEVLMLQAEPTAAAIAYGLDKEKDQTILVYDLGGGTFDVSILKIIDNNFTVLATGGDNDLGGDDFDLSIIDFLLKEILIEHQLDLKNDNSKAGIIAKQKLKEVSEQAKIDLSSSNKTSIYFPNLLNLGVFEYELTRSKFVELITPYLEKTIEIIKNTAKEANLGKEDINRVICVGGSTKSPIVKEMITNELKAPYIASNVDEIVAQGAAITGASLVQPILIEGDNKPIDLNVINITSFDLGIRLDDDVFGVLINKNAQLPIIKEKIFTTKNLNATETEIEIFQGDASKKCSLNTPLGGFKLKGITKSNTGSPQVLVKFELNKSDILLIEASDLSSKTSSKLIIEKFIPKPYVPDAKKTKELHELRVGVSRVGFDNVGAILSKINIFWTKIKDKEFAKTEKLRNYDILFINCLAGGSASKNANALRNFVDSGGVLYVSDCAKSHIVKAFPNELKFKSNSYYSGKTKCKIVDKDLVQILNKKDITIKFDSVLHVCNKINNTEGKILIDGKKAPIVVSFPYGKGFVLFTAFHNYASATKEEIELLKFILLKPLSVAINTSLIELSKRL